MNTRSLIKAHRPALPVINFPPLLHWQLLSVPLTHRSHSCGGEGSGRRRAVPQGRAAFAPSLLLRHDGEKP